MGTMTDIKYCILNETLYFTFCSGNDVRDWYERRYKLV